MLMRRECSFCGKPEADVLRLSESPRALICNECVALCMEIFAEGAGERPPGLMSECSFCDRTDRDRYVAGPTVFVCDDCVRRFADRV